MSTTPTVPTNDGTQAPVQQSQTGQQQPGFSDLLMKILNQPMVVPGRQQGAPPDKGPNQLQYQSQSVGRRTSETDHGHFTAAAILNGVMSGLTQVYNKKEQDKHNAAQADLQRAMQAAQANQQLQTAIAQAQDPATKKMLQDAFEKNNAVLESVASGKHSAYIKKALGAIANPMGGEANPKQVQMVHQAATATANRTNLLQRAFGALKGGGAKGTVPVQPQTQQMPSANTAAGTGQMAPTAQQPQQAQQSVPAQQSVNAQPPAMGGPSFNGGSQGTPQTVAQAPKLSPAAQQIQKGLDNWSVYTVASNPVRDQALKEYMELVKVGVIPKAKDLAQMEHWNAQDHIAVEKLKLASNLAQVAAQTHLSVAAIQANARIAVEQIKAQNRLRIASQLVGSKQVKTQVAGLKLQASVLQSQVGNGTTPGTLDRAIAEQEKYVESLKSKTQLSANPVKMYDALKTGPSARGAAQAQLTDAQKKLDALKKDKEQKQYQLVETQNRLLVMGEQGAGDAGTDGGNLTINFNDESSEAAGQDSTGDFDKIFSLLNSKGEGDGEAASAEDSED